MLKVNTLVTQSIVCLYMASRVNEFTQGLKFAETIFLDLTKIKPFTSQLNKVYRSDQVIILKFMKTRSIHHIGL